jgi:hypothetical protein
MQREKNPGPGLGDDPNPPMGLVSHPVISTPRFKVNANSFQKPPMLFSWRRAIVNA